MNKEIMSTILEKIKEYDRIIIFRHFRPDGDAVGSTKGLQRILQLSFPQKQILLINDDYSDYLAFLGGEDPAIPDEEYADALGIVLDTATLKRVSNQKCTLCKELIKIDHHIPVEDYGSYNWVEEQRSSACELVVKFYDTFRNELVIDKEAATCLYTGMVTDSGRFQFSSVSGDTMRYAAILLDQGLDTDMIFAHLYLKDFDELKFKSHVYKKMKITPNGVAYVHIDRAMQRRFGLNGEVASTSVGFMDSIKGAICWIAFIDSQKGPEIRVRLRSRFCPINTLAEKYRGGGHACACGATLLTKKEIKLLLQEADALIKNYKETHEDWL